ncbi:MAG: Lrp/AsnC ligand binding domain-containing protein [Candidatus Bathyarchaeota archaeon]|nr:Lrp/AsnC ligand binding domain-containing protein [Candidatus Bathyarchaeota archaeon]
MTVKAYLMCKVNSGGERDICKKLTEFVNVIESCIVYGEYDVIVKLQARDLDELDFVTEEMRRSTPGIILTSTAIVAREYKGKTQRTTT